MPEVGVRPRSAPLRLWP